MARFRTIIFDHTFEAYEEETTVLAEVDAEVINIRVPATEADPELVSAADAVLLNLLPMDAANIAALGDRCRIISRYGVGMDNVDVEAATAAGIWCANVQHYAREDVSDHALALLMGCVRRITERDREIRKGLWNSATRLHSFRMKGKTLGIIGLGDIGGALNRKVSGFGLAKVLAYDPYVEEATIRKANAEPCSLERLIAESDYISIHAPLNDETRGIIGAPELKAMRPGAILINTSRGPLVDENALAHAVREGQIAGAGVDVFATEPLPDNSPLRELENIVLTDHAGWYSEESIVQLKTECAINAREVLKGNPPVYPMNSL